MPIHLLQDKGVCEVSIKIEPYHSFGISSVPDTEWQRIIHKLWVVYGVRSTGSKTLDRQKLHELELTEVKEKNGEVNSEFLTVTKAEIDKIKEKIKENIIKQNPKEYSDQHGAQILGEQIYIAIQMKNDEDNRENKKKRENKYQS